MTKDETPNLHEGRVSVLAAIANSDLESDDAVTVLAQITRQIANKSSVLSTTAAAGYEATNYSCNKDLELYFDLQHGERSVGYISKGWDDPGFRIGEIIVLEGSGKRTGKWVDELRDYCATNGIALTLYPTDGGTEVRLESVLYAEGFNTSVLAGSLDSLRNCRRKVEAKQHQMIGSLLSSE